MPEASAGVVKYHYLDHDTDVVSEAPPVQDTWYEVFHAQDVRLLYCVIKQTNTEVAAKDVEVRWTIDGNVYFISHNLVDTTIEYIYRSYAPSSGGTAGLSANASARNGASYTCKRGLDFKVEVRMTAVPGTAQTLRCWCVRETLEET